MLSRRVKCEQFVDRMLMNVCFFLQRETIVVIHGPAMVEEEVVLMELDDNDAPLEGLETPELLVCIIFATVFYLYLGLREPYTSAAAVKAMVVRSFNNVLEFRCKQF